jgi:hypothetical protein
LIVPEARRKRVLPVLAVRHRQIARSLQPAARLYRLISGPALQGVNAFKSYFLYCTIIQVRT